MKPKTFLLLSWLLALLCLSARSADVTYVPSTIRPPAPLREFRAAWVATVANIDWPSAPGLPVAQQKAELIAILDRAVRLNLNTIVFQVRDVCDAMYSSQIEPWSYYLTGVMGKPPQPFYDPLTFAITEAHRRGLQLHAWISPFRAGHPSQKPPFAPNHITRTRPNLVRSYGTLLWLDPGDREAQDFSLSVIMDVVQRYDIDGIHFDDRLGYPTEDDAQKHHIDFPDSATWKHYLANGGKLSRDEWRRENINTFVHRVYENVKSAKPWVQVGIAPAGIWQPGYPAQIRGQNAYNILYTDARKWLVNGWVDYLSPQLYWSIDPPSTSFPALYKWWLQQNPRHRHVWPGMASYKVGDDWKAKEIISQIQVTRGQSADPGNLHWSMKCLLQDRGGLATTLAREVYNEPALIPPSPWLETNSPAQPKLTVHTSGKLKWESSGPDKVSWWVVQIKSGGHWTTEILSGEVRTQSVTANPEAVAVTAIDRCGVASPPMVLEQSVVPEKAPEPIRPKPPVFRSPKDRSLRQ